MSQAQNLGIAALIQDSASPRHKKEHARSRRPEVSNLFQVGRCYLAFGYGVRECMMSTVSLAGSYGFLLTPTLYCPAQYLLPVRSCQASAEGSTMECGLGFCQSWGFCVEVLSMGHCGLLQALHKTMGDSHLYAGRRTWNQNMTLLGILTNCVSHHECSKIALALGE